MALVAIGVAVNRTPRDWSNYAPATTVDRMSRAGMTRPADLVNQVWERKAMCLSAFRGQAAIKQTLPTGFLGSDVSDPGEGAWSPSSSRPITTIRVVSIRWGIGVYGGSYKMRRTRMRPSRWMMVSSVREGGPNSKGFSQSTKGRYRGPRLLPPGRAEKGAAEENT